MLIRRYRRTDLGAVIELFYETVHTINSRDYTADQLNAWAPAVADKDIWRKRFSSSFAYVAEQYRMIVGFGNLTQDGWVDMLYTHRNHQREGVASAILTRLCEDARAMHLPVLHVTASITAKHFFESHGFSLDWEQDKAHKGSVFKSYVMTKSLHE